MPKVQYGTTEIAYVFVEKKEQTAHYISVEKDVGVRLTGKKVSAAEAEKMILKRAAWILQKLELVKTAVADELVTGSRMLYLGRRYYVQFCHDDSLTHIAINFTASKFQIHLPKRLHTPADLDMTFEDFFRKKAIEKITPRVKRWSKQLDLPYKTLKFRKLEKRWGSCTASNNIIINIEAIKLPYSLIDYLIVHELVHTKIKNHSKEFWAELATHLHNWRELDAKIGRMKL